MEKQNKAAGEMVSISIDETVDRTELFGGMDHNLRIVEDE